MKVVLRSNVDGVGKTGDVVEVANGFAQNFLMPQGLAIRATAGTARRGEAMKRRAASIMPARSRGTSSTKTVSKVCASAW